MRAYIILNLYGRTPVYGVNLINCTIKIIYKNYKNNPYIYNGCTCYMARATIGINK